ncbi:uncharacterized protein UBRO_20132 [Ustilago bromivora]|uniref:Uncharacterized protein n=1 Tax=Ustilago bromivora TaxID=307758 RepID=A0A1K0GW09_9BASI|nr:uncharacterized protein UBRO_20132 [Ustilago bromivora]
MRIHSTTMTRKHGYIDVFAVSPATLLSLYEASSDTTPPPLVSPTDPYDVPLPSTLLPLLSVDGETSCCFIPDRGHSHFIQVTKHTLLHLTHPLAPSSSSCRAPASSEWQAQCHHHVSHCETCGRGVLNRVLHEICCMIVILLIPVGFIVRSHSYRFG